MVPLIQKSLLKILLRKASDKSWLPLAIYFIVLGLKHIWNYVLLEITAKNMEL